ncbi:MAG: phosphoribosylanthranilate isomerase [Methylophilales bacterium]|nr:phosphoribosylanthranilate isomerase [Methylophilales bacterium]
MRVRTKICGITRAEDALSAVACGADAIGLVFAESPRRVTTEQAATIVAALPPFVDVVGLFVNAEASEVRRIMHAVNLSLLQFHGDETPEFCAQFDFPYIKAVRVKQGLNLLQYATDFSDAKALLLDAYQEGVAGGTGKTFDWNLIPNELPKPVILAGGLNAENVHEAIKKVRPYAVDVSGGVESAKGIKDAEKIGAFLREVNRVNI